MRFPGLSALPLFCAFALASAVPAAPQGDEAYGLVGTGGKAFAARFGLKYYTLEGNYSAGGGAVFSSVHPANDPDPGFSVVREVAKLNVRTDSLGETNVQFQAKLNAHAKALATWYITPSWARGSKPAFTWYKPKPEALAAAESLQIVETIRREKVRNPSVTGTVWEIGNEPNLFPAILPAEYAAIFEAYRRIIKAEDPQAVVAMGSLFMPEPNQDLKARLGEELETKMRAELQAAGAYNTLNSLGYFDDLVNDMENTMLSRMLSLSTREYLRQVLNATAARPDLVTLHAYPYDDRAPLLDSAALRNVLDTTFAGVQAQLLGQGSTARIWITEFGNIEQGKDEEAVAARSVQLLAAFRARDSIGKWFHYKSTGSDEQFALFSSGTPPLTRLAVDPAFAPASGDFTCDKLNAVGRAYYRESHGGAACQDAALKVFIPSIKNAEGSTLSPGALVRWSWPGDSADPALDAATLSATFEFRFDSASASASHAFHAPPGAGVQAALSGPAGPVWVRVRLKDGSNQESPWSAPVRLAWSGAATSALADGGLREMTLEVLAGRPGSPQAFRIGLPVASWVKLEILSPSGVRIPVFQGVLGSGRYVLPLANPDGRKIPPGIFVARLSTSGSLRSLVFTVLP